MIGSPLMGVIAASRRAGGGGGTTDPFFANVALLLHFDGTNGSTTVTDSSGSPATVSCNSGAALSTAQKKFGTASLLLDGTNDYVNTNRSCGITTGAFTLESQVRGTAAQAGRIISNQHPAAVNAVIALRVTAAGALNFFLRSSAGGTLINLASADGLVAQNDSIWQHAAVTRDGSGNITLWLEGASVATTTSSIDPSGSGRGYDIGTQYGVSDFFAGYIDEVRITEGVCRYTGAFTPPVAPFPNS